MEKVNGMKEEDSKNVFFEQMPFLNVWYKVLILYILQFLVFISVILFFWQISSRIFFGALIGQLIIAFSGVYPYRYIALNIGRIRQKYRKKYDNLACQYLWYHYESYTIPLLSSSLYLPILLKTDYFLPKIFNLPSHIITNSLFPIYLAIPFGIIIIIFGLLIRKPSGGFGPSVESYFYLLYPEKGKLITEGIYKYIRNPRYLSRGLIAIGLGIIANNILAILVGFIHFLAFASLIIPEDRELLQRFGNDFKIYQKQVPALIPRYGNWKNFLKYIFNRDKNE